MFTGIIEEIGWVKQVKRQGSTLVLSIAAKTVLSDVKLGDSISVNGVCLTVTDFSKEWFYADVMPETFRKTNLKDLQTGSPVNLERAMQAGARFGGHIVQGHVDGTGQIVSRQSYENAVVFKIKPSDAKLSRLILPTGSITIDGISLTVVSSDDDLLTISIIPHTLQQTSLGTKQAGDTVNIECDIIGKYVHHLLGIKHGLDHAEQGITEQTLIKYGFM
ncbi:riboflavin synthase [Marinicrinis lubricantis]|uniref:Riboflavin synthase n=1 Tax=Marinicrinis lubricantis TaxID=2086470 RepID=A0ABW1ISI2_9BACL